MAKKQQIVWTPGFSLSLSLILCICTPLVRLSTMSEHRHGSVLLLSGKIVQGKGLLFHEALLVSALLLVG